jgi:hypothetical protein
VRQDVVSDGSFRLPLQNSQKCLPRQGAVLPKGSTVLHQGTRLAAASAYQTSGFSNRLEQRLCVTCAQWVEVNTAVSAWIIPLTVLSHEAHTSAEASENLGRDSTYWGQSSAPFINGVVEMSILTSLVLHHRPILSRAHRADLCHF